MVKSLRGNEDTDTHHQERTVASNLYLATSIYFTNLYFLTSSYPIEFQLCVNVTLYMGMVMNIMLLVTFI